MYCKLFASLYQGTLRGKAHPILVFTNLLAHADAAGIVDKHFKAIAEEVGITIDEVYQAIKELEAPDPESRSPEMQGARIVKLDDHRVWGWKIVNYGKYRAIKNEDDRREQNRLAQERWRKKRQEEISKSVSKVSKVSLDKPQSAQAEAEAEAEEYKKRVWAKPTIEQVRLLMAKCGGPESEALKFFNFYESKNWLIGKNRMTSVGHAVGGWVARWKERNLNGNTSYQRNCAENPRNAGTCESTTDFEAVVRRKQEAQVAGQMALLNVAPQSTTETA